MGERRYWVRFYGDPAKDPREPAPRARPGDDDAAGSAGDAGTAARPDDPGGTPRGAAPQAPRGRGLRPASAPAGGAVAVCPHCWHVNVRGERLCGRCGADMTLLLQESGGLRRTPAVQSPVPVRVAERLGPVARALLLLLTVLLALAWLVAPLLGTSYRRMPGPGRASASRAPNGRQNPSPQRTQRAQRFTEAGVRGTWEYAAAPAAGGSVLKL